MWGQCNLAVTIKDIARQCGVSRQSVSYALTGTGRLSAQTRERIIHVARELGYRPNSIARTMRTGRFGAATLLLSSEAGSSHVPSPLLDGIHDALQANDMHLTIARLGQQGDDYAPKLIREWASDGLLVNFMHDVSPAVGELVERYSIPTIWYNASRESDCIGPNDAEATQTATTRLIELGHRRITMIVYQDTNELARPHFSVHDRWRGYDSIMSGAGLTPDAYPNEEPVSDEDSVAFSLELLRRADRPTAVITYGQKEFCATMRAAGIVGLRVPDDLSVVTFSGGGPEREILGATHVFMPTYKMGREAVNMLLKKIDDPNTNLPRQVLECPWHEGKTIAPPAAE